MKTFGKLTLILVLLTTLAISALPAFAQESRTFTLTEEEINNSYAVTNPFRRSLSDVQVDLQPGQVVISATLQLRRQLAKNVVGTFVPNVTNGRIYWTMTAATVDGEPASSDLVTQINNALSSSWVNYWRRNAQPGRFTAIDITDTDLTVTYTRR